MPTLHRYPHPQWSQLRTAEIAPFRMRKQPMRFPPLAVIGCFPTLIYIVGGLLLVGAAVILVARRKASN